MLACGLSHSGSGLSLLTAWPPCVPKETPFVHGKVVAPFQTAFSGSGRVRCVGNTESSIISLTWGTPGSDTVRAVTRPAVFLSSAVNSITLLLLLAES